jgi:hypothetical protein
MERGGTDLVALTNGQSSIDFVTLDCLQKCIAFV